MQADDSVFGISRVVLSTVLCFCGVLCVGGKSKPLTACQLACQKGACLHRFSVIQECLKMQVQMKVQSCVVEVPPFRGGWWPTFESCVIT